MSIGAATSGQAVALEGLGSVPGDLLGDAEVVGELRGLVGLGARVGARAAGVVAAGELSECRVRLLAAARDSAPGLFCRDEGLLVSQARTLPSRVFPPAV